MKNQVTALQQIDKKIPKSNRKESKILEDVWVVSRKLFYAETRTVLFA